MRHTYIKELLTYYSKKGKEEIRYLMSDVRIEISTTWIANTERKMHILKQEYARVD